MEGNAARVAALALATLALTANAANRPATKTERFDVPQGKSLRMTVRFNIAGGGEFCLVQSSTNAV